MFKMNLTKILVTFATVLCMVYAQDEIPVIGSVLGTLTNASKGVISGVIDTIDNVGHGAYGIVDDLKDKFLNLIEQFRERMTEGIIELGLPQLEPLTIEHADFDIKHEIGNFQGSLDNVKISKLSKFNVEDIEIKLLQFQVILNLTFNEIDISGQYKIDGEFGELVHVYGEGPFTAEVRDVKTGVDVKIAFENGVAVIRHIYLTFSMKNMTCDFKNLMGGGENAALFNKVIGQLAPEAVEVLWPEIEPIVEERLKQEGNEKLKDIPIEQILDLFRPNKP